MRGRVFFPVLLAFLMAVVLNSSCDKKKDDDAKAKRENKGGRGDSSGQQEGDEGGSSAGQKDGGEQPKEGKKPGAEQPKEEKKPEEKKPGEEQPKEESAEVREMRRKLQLAEEKLAEAKVKLEEAKAALTQEELAAEKYVAGVYAELEKGEVVKDLVEGMKANELKSQLAAVEMNNKTAKTIEPKMRQVAEMIAELKGLATAKDFDGMKKWVEDKKAKNLEDLVEIIQKQDAKHEPFRTKIAMGLIQNGIVTPVNSLGTTVMVAVEEHSAGSTSEKYEGLMEVLNGSLNCETNGWNKEAAWLRSSMELYEEKNLAMMKQGVQEAAKLHEEKKIYHWLAKLVAIFPMVDFMNTFNDDNLLGGAQLQLVLDNYSGACYENLMKEEGCERCKRIRGILDAEKGRFEGEYQKSVNVPGKQKAINSAEFLVKKTERDLEVAKENLKKAEGK